MQTGTHRSRVALCACVLLSACGGGGGGSGSNPQPPPQPNDPPPAPVLPPPAPVLEVQSDLKQLIFNWASVAGATSYRLLHNPDGASGFTVVGADQAANVTRATLDMAVHRHDWVNALYRLEACNARGCAASGAMSAVNAMVQAIGYFKASNTQAGDRFGTSIAMSADGSTLAVGASGEDSNAAGVGGAQNDNSAEAAGAVYVFTRIGALWAQQAYVKASNPEPGDQFGLAVALSADGTTLAVGAPLEASDATVVGGDQDNNNASEAGAVYVFTRAGTQWTQQDYVKASNTGVQDRFGASLALSADGNTLAAGTVGEDSNATGVGGEQNDNTADGAGAVYVFTRAGTRWTQQAYVKASNTGVRDGFGTLALSADGNTLAVGAFGEGSNAIGVNGDQANNDADRAGAAYVFTRIGVLWTQQAYVKASNTEAGEVFGAAVSLSGDGNTLAVGAPLEASNATGVDGNQGNNVAADAGAVYVFTRAGTQWSQQAYVKASNTRAADFFGLALALSMDGNTLAVGAPFEDGNAIGVGGDQSSNNGSAAGAVYVFTRAATQWSQRAYAKASNTGADDTFGISLALSADGNSLAVGARLEDGNDTGVGGNQNDNAASDAGALYIF